MGEKKENKWTAYYIIILFLIILIVIGLGFISYKSLETVNSNQEPKEEDTKISKQTEETTKEVNKEISQETNKKTNSTQNAVTQTNLNYDEIYKATLQTYYDKVMASKDKYYGYSDDGKTTIKSIPKYCYYDIDKNGVKELIVSIGWIEAEKVTYCYTYSNNQVINLGIIAGGHSILYTMNNEKYLLKVIAHMGEERVTHIKLENNKIVEEVVSTSKVSVYTKGDKELVFKEYRPTAIVKASNTEMYNSIINEYKKAMKDGNYYNVDVKSKYPNVNTTMMNYYHGTPFNVYYAYYDVNRDNVDELLVLSKHDNIYTIIDVFAYDGNKVIKVVKEKSLGDRSRLEIYSLGIMCLRGSSGASSGSLTFYEILKSGYGDVKEDKYYYQYNGSEVSIYSDEEYKNKLDYSSTDELVKGYKGNTSAIDLNSLSLHEIK